MLLSQSNRLCITVVGSLTFITLHLTKARILHILNSCRLDTALPLLKGDTRRERLYSIWDNNTIMRYVVNIIHRLGRATLIATQSQDVKKRRHALILGSSCLSIITFASHLSLNGIGESRLHNLNWL